MIPQVVNTYGFHRGFIEQGDYLAFFVQLVLFQFLHGDLLHLFLNGYFLYAAGPEVETRMSKDRYISFFVSSTLFVAMSLYLLSPLSLTIGISGFCMALLSYLWIDLYTIRHPMATQIGIMLIINILLWLSGNISFVGHAAGAVWGIVWWQMRKKW
jgi:rhomboid protease GluP